MSSIMNQNLGREVPRLREAAQGVHALLERNRATRRKIAADRARLTAEAERVGQLPPPKVLDLDERAAALQAEGLTLSGKLAEATEQLRVAEAPLLAKAEAEHRAAAAARARAALAAAEAFDQAAQAMAAALPPLRAAAVPDWAFQAALKFAGHDLVDRLEVHAIADAVPLASMVARQHAAALIPERNPAND